MNKRRCLCILSLHLVQRGGDWGGPQTAQAPPNVTALPSTDRGKQFHVNLKISFTNFYRATRMHSADYAVARCLSVRLSVTRPYSVQTVTCILKVFSPSGSPTILVFFIPNGMAIFQRPTPNGRVECMGGIKKSRFSTNIWLYRGNDAR